ncbi:hypothetical protein HYPSUDRAFT_956340 [Hypholoma sublateritium FD-334 SS-4]|uniref:Uncharacterized protein n=1 Tax=Hypholoma sublateritium (strain FD-334 SS-4) TaxID=945553 RepID=A0A0D2NHE9_HYPSF|nr:hypothetical protein HYPSUDRAFT_956340 [Hypholoma sublateritium FD-334 SS-4]
MEGDWGKQRACTKFDCEVLGGRSEDAWPGICLDGHRYRRQGEQQRMWWISTAVHPVHGQMESWCACLSITHPSETADLDTITHNVPPLLIRSFLRRSISQRKPAVGVPQPHSSDRVSPWNLGPSGCRKDRRADGTGNKDYLGRVGYIQAQRNGQDPHLLYDGAYYQGVGDAYGRTAYSVMDALEVDIAVACG